MREKVECPQCGLHIAKCGLLSHMRGGACETQCEINLMKRDGYQLYGHWRNGLALNEFRKHHPDALVRIEYTSFYPGAKNRKGRYTLDLWYKE